MAQIKQFIIKQMSVAIMLNDNPYNKLKCLSNKKKNYSICFTKSSDGLYSVNFKDIALNGPAFFHGNYCICKVLKGIKLNHINNVLTLNILIVDKQGDVLLVRTQNVWEALKFKYDGQMPINQFIKLNLNKYLVTEFSQSINPNYYMGYNVHFIQEMLIESIELSQEYASN